MAFQVLWLLMFRADSFLKVLHCLVNGLQLLLKYEGSWIELNLFGRDYQKLVILSVSDKIEAEGAVVFYVEPLWDTPGTKRMHTHFQLLWVLLCSKTNGTNQVLNVHSSLAFNICNYYIGLLFNFEFSSYYTFIHHQSLSTVSDHFWSYLAKKINLSRKITMKKSKVLKLFYFLDWLQGSF